MKTRVSIGFIHEYRRGNHDHICVAADVLLRTLEDLDRASIGSEVPDSDGAILGRGHQNVFPMCLNLSNGICVELENVFDGKSGGVVQFDLVVGGRDDHVTTVGDNVKNVNVAMRECRCLLESERWLNKARLKCDGDWWWDSVVHDGRVVVKEWDGWMSTVKVKSATNLDMLLSLAV